MSIKSSLITKTRLDLIHFFVTFFIFLYKKKTVDVFPFTLFQQPIYSFISLTRLMVDLTVWAAVVLETDGQNTIKTENSHNLKKRFQAYAKT